MSELCTRQPATREMRGKPDSPTSRYSNRPHVNKLPVIERRRSFESGSSNMQPVCCCGSGGRGCEASAGLGPNRERRLSLTDRWHTPQCRTDWMSSTYAHDPWLAMGHWELLSCRKLGCGATSRCAGSLFTCSRAKLPPSSDCQWKS